MAMRRSTKRELAKLREIVRFVLRDQCCVFCHKPLLENCGDVQTDGDGRGRPVNADLTIHHADGDHENQKRSNKRLAHQKCHKSHHAKIAWKAFHKKRRGLKLNRRERLQTSGGFFVRRSCPEVSARVTS
jgi:hypothetical protein